MNKKLSKLDLEIIALTPATFTTVYFATGSLEQAIDHLYRVVKKSVEVVDD